MTNPGNDCANGKAQRVLIVSLNYAPEMIAIGVYSSGMAEYMSRNGVETHVIAARPYYPAWRTYEGWRRPWWALRRGPEGTRVVHCPIYVPRAPTGGRRILHHLSFALSAFPVLLWKALIQRPDLILLVAPSLISAPGVLAAARLSGAATWLHVQDFEVEAAFATGLLDQKSLVGRLAERFEHAVLGSFDRVSSISGPMLSRLRRKDVAEWRITEFRNWADISKVKPITGVSPLKAELGIDTPHVALYSGNLANKQGLEILPDMARRLRHRTDLTIAVCGDGPMRGILKQQAQDLPMMRFFPLQPVDRLSDLLGMADLHLLPQIAGAADLVLPSKLTNMLASGRPVLATADPDTALGQEVTGCGRLVPPGDAAALAREVEALLDDAPERTRLGAAAGARAVERWDMRSILARFREQIHAVIRDPRPAEGQRDLSRF
ncbi:colanic acid biosynthesis glycosyl transferase [Salipiger aestuarii]|uniref:Colanic acid biosynthesis glycosyl transferase WcaI n=1 Tax=Salipiger aestuarii TaxID=568098 RepID=A0A327XUK6_9RHOB|nr:WcaI family glycosyltransferase [Salipiger aestuarii]KAA8606411.1 colanic acid biosynthesis glycosyl transferase [Salipiger aestuarii]KAB2540736.1 colanic acid biosynthesis glycosyl transferase [Salipiger aestuarii]RAK11666.1 colanic acid biosynthesis glycosyl transferase WcaI [Salipiger aestuarii]